MKTKYKIFIAKILYLIFSFFGIFKYKKVERDKIKWSLDISEGIDLSIFIFGNFEKGLIKIIKKLSEKKKFDIIDIGANIGVHTLQFAKEFQNSNIYAVEPTDFAYNKLVKNISLNHKLKENIKHFQYFIGDQELPNEIYSSWSLSKSSNSHSLHKGILKKTTSCLSIALDEFLINNVKSKELIIKCDVDGYELDVFKSGEKFLTKYKPHIIMELAPYLYKENGYSENDLFNFFSKFNYKFYDGENFKEIKNISFYSSKIKSGSSKNIFLK